MISAQIFIDAIEYVISNPENEYTSYHLFNNFLSLSKRLKKIILYSRFYLNHSLITASLQSDPARVRSLINRGADASINNNNCLIISAFKGNLEVFKLLSDAADITDDTGLREAVAYERYDILKYILEEKNVNIQRYFIDLAAQSGNLEIFKLLIAHGANPRSDGYYPFSCACQLNKCNIILYYLDVIKINNPDILTNNLSYIIQRDLDIVKKFIELGADIHADINKSLILSTIVYNKIENLKYLIELGADITHTDNCALLSASMSHNADAVKILIEAGADVHARDETALRFAALSQNKELVQYLIARGADVDKVKRDVLAAKENTFGYHKKIITFLDSIL